MNVQLIMNVQYAIILCARESVLEKNLHERCATHSVEAWCSLFSMVQPVSMPFMVASRNTMCYQMVVLLVGIRAECRYVQIESIKYEKPIGNDSISYTLIVYEKDTGNNPISEMHTTCQRANNICV